MLRERNKTRKANNTNHLKQSDTTHTSQRMERERERERKGKRSGRQLILTKISIQHTATHT
jgi:hypothetical protein